MTFLYLTTGYINTGHNFLSHHVLNYYYLSHIDVSVKAYAAMLCKYKIERHFLPQQKFFKLNTRHYNKYSVLNTVSCGEKMEKERQRKWNCMLIKGSKINPHHLGIILQLRIIPSCQKPPLDVYLQWYFWDIVSAQCKIQLAQLLFYFFSIKHFLVIRIPGTAFKSKIFCFIALGSDLVLFNMSTADWLR